MAVQMPACWRNCSTSRLPGRAPLRTAPTGMRSRQQGIDLRDDTAGSERHQDIVHVKGLHLVVWGMLGQDDPAPRKLGVLERHPALAATVPFDAVLLETELAELLVKSAVGQGCLL